MSLNLIFAADFCNTATMKGKTELINALEMLGELLEHKGLHFELAIVGGAALLLRNLISRSTLDMDTVAIISSAQRWGTPHPLPDKLVTAVREVAEALDLPRQPRDEKDWLDSGPSVLARLGLPQGFKDRTTRQQFGGLTLRIASRIDLIHLKLWSATDPARGARRDVDVEDLQTLKPTEEELRTALEWCAQMDGREDFIAVNAAPILHRLGFRDGDATDE